MIAYDHQKTNINNIAKIAPVEIQPANMFAALLLESVISFLHELSKAQGNHHDNFGLFHDHRYCDPANGKRAGATRALPPDARSRTESSRG